MLNTRSLLSIALAALPIVSFTQASVAQTAPLVLNKTHTLSIARYLGGTGNNEARSTAYASNGDILVGGNFANLQTTGITSSVLSGAGFSDPGKVLRLSNDGKQVLAQITLGRRIDSLQIRDRIVVGGDFGVVVLNKDFNVIWQNSLPGLAAGDGKPDGGQTRVAIDSSGRVAVSRAKTVTLFSNSGQKLVTKAIAQDFVNDVAIDPAGKRVYVVGYSNRRSNSTPVQVSFLQALDAQNNLADSWKTWGYTPALLSDPNNNNMADSRLYRVVIDGTSRVVVLGESAGGNSIYRWNGKDLTTPTSVGTDMYNQAYNTKSNHILYYAKVNAADGRVLAGQFTLTRLSKAANGQYPGNTIRAKDGALAVDRNGRIYIGGVAAYAIAERDSNTINGQSIAPYAGSDMYLLTVSADLKQRLRWTVFPASPKGGGTMNALAVQNNTVALFGTVEFGEMITTDGYRRFNPVAGTNKDAYFSILRTD